MFNDKSSKNSSEEFDSLYRNIRKKMGLEIGTNDQQSLVSDAVEEISSEPSDNDTNKMHTANATPLSQKNQALFKFDLDSQIDSILETAFTNFTTLLQ